MVTTKPYQRITSVAELRHTADILGSHFFSPSSMRFFNSRVLEGIYYTPNSGTDHGFFVTSERDDDYGNGAAWDGERRYTVRSFTITRDRRESDGREFDSISIDSVSEFGEYATARQAKAAARSVAGLK